MKSYLTLLSLKKPLSLCVHFIGDGADAALQPAVGGGDEEQTDSREGSSAQDSAQRGQDPHGHVQEEPPHHCHCIRHPGAGEGADKTGTDSVATVSARHVDVNEHARSFFNSTVSLWHTDSPNICPTQTELLMRPACLTTKFSIHHFTNVTDSTDLNIHYLLNLLLSTG